MLGRLTYPVRVLFLCTANSGRSQIAEALLLKKGSDRFIVASAGPDPAAAVAPDAVAALRDHGINWSAAKPKGFEAVDSQQWDLVITLCDRLRESCVSLPNRRLTVHWGVPDPAAAVSSKKRAAYDDVVNLLSWRIDLMLALRLDQFETLILEHRLQDIAAAQPPHQDARMPPKVRPREDRA